MGIMMQGESGLHSGWGLGLILRIAGFSICGVD